MNGSAGGGDSLLRRIMDEVNAFLDIALETLQARSEQTFLARINAGKNVMSLLGPPPLRVDQYLFGV